MFGNSYYCFIAGLPEIFWDDRKLSLSVGEFREQAEVYLSKKDLDLLNLFFLPNDNVQVLRLLNKLEPAGDLQTVYPLSILEDELTEPKNLPSYLCEFIENFKEEHLKYDQASENVLSWMYYDYMMTSPNKFVSRYAEFSMNLKNLVTALNCRKFGLSVEKEVIGDNDFSTALRTVNTKDFGLSMDYPFVEKVIALMESNNLVDREKGLDMLIWNFLDEAVVFEYFSVEKVLSFMLKLMILERWSKMNSESGRKVFMEMIREFRESFQFNEV